MANQLPVYKLVDREQRIAARRQRIAAQLQAKKDAEGANQQETVTVKQLGRGELKVLAEKRNFSKTLAAGTRTITNIRLAQDEAESRRRTEEEARRQELRQKMLQEAEQSSRDNAEVAGLWASLYAVEVPQELLKMIKQQQEACAAIIASKDRLINELRGDLKNKDNEYVKALKRQVEDTEQLIRLMGEQSAMLVDLQSIEDEFLAERKALLTANGAELDALFEQGAAKETAFMENSARRAEEYYNALETQRAQDAEDFSVLKNRLETDIHNLEQHLEAMRATYQLNTEKLEYNYRVLVERDHENQSTIAQQKRKIARQRDLLSGLKAKYARSDKAAQDENNKLTDEYRRVTEQFKDLQTKFRHFESADAKTYQRVLENNRHTCTILVKKLLEADRLIHTALLSLRWVPPSEQVFSAVPTTGAAAAAAAEAEAEEAEEKARGTLADRLADARYSALKALLCDEAGYLAEVRVRAALETLQQSQHGDSEGAGTAAPPPAAGRVGSAAAAAAASAPVSAEAVVGALGITDAADFDALVARLVDPATLGTGDEGAHLVDPETVVQRLKQFIEEELRSLPSRSRHPAQHLPTTRATRRDVYEQEYWERLGNVVSEKTCKVWRALYSAMQRYNALLEGRSQALSEMNQLQRQNEELRGLLETYGHSKQAAALIIPPGM